MMQHNLRNMNMQTSYQQQNSPRLRILPLHIPRNCEDRATARGRGCNRQNGVIGQNAPDTLSDADKKTAGGGYNMIDFLDNVDAAQQLHSTVGGKIYEMKL